MSKSPQDRLHNRLESLFAGLIESTPRTGALSPLRLGLSDKEPAQGWVWETDAQGTIVWCSPEIEQVLGYTLEQALDRKVSELGFNTRSAQILQQAIAAQEEIHDLRLEARTRAGEDLILVVNALVRQTLAGEKLGYRGVALVLDRRKPAASAHATRAPHLPAEVTPHTPAPIVVSWANASGYLDDGTSLRPLDDRLPLAAPTGAGDTLVVPLRGQDAVLGFLELEARQGAKPWSQDDRLLVEGVAQQLALAMQDARTYQLTQQALEEMREADRLKSQFLANMSHELRTPLNSIIGFSRVILKGIDGPVNETQTQDLQAIYNAGQLLLGLINDILDLSRIDAGKMELAFSEVDMSEIIRSVMGTATGLVKDKPIELLIDVPDDLPLIQADNIRVRQILLNLVSNACKFTEKGHVGVTARAVERGGKREVVVAVFDTGPGIAPADQSRLFEPFSQVDSSPTRKSGGTGLGLSICRQLVSLHSGRIWVESTLGEGSTFAFSLPVEGPALPAAEPTEAPLVLIVDAEAASRQALSRAIEQTGLRTHALAEHARTFEVIRDLHPAGIVLAAGLPEAAAWRLLSEIRADNTTSGIPAFVAALRPEAGLGYWPGPLEMLRRPVVRDDLNLLLGRLGLKTRETPPVMVVSAQEDERAGLVALISNTTGATTTAADDGLQAWAAAVAQPPGLIIVDVDMPAPGGLQLVEALKQDERTRPVPVALLASGPLSPAQLDDLRRRADRLQEKSAPLGTVLDEIAARMKSLLRTQSGQEGSAPVAPPAEAADGVTR